MVGRPPELSMPRGQRLLGAVEQLAFAVKGGVLPAQLGRLAEDRRDGLGLASIALEVGRKSRRGGLAGLLSDLVQGAVLGLERPDVLLAGRKAPLRRHFTVVTATEGLLGRLHRQLAALLSLGLRLCGSLCFLALTSEAGGLFLSLDPLALGFGLLSSSLLLLLAETVGLGACSIELPPLLLPR